MTDDSEKNNRRFTDFKVRLLLKNAVRFAFNKHLFTEFFTALTDTSNNPTLAKFLTKTHFPWVILHSENNSELSGKETHNTLSLPKPVQTELIFGSSISEF